MHTRKQHNPARAERHIFFGEINSATWIALMLAHELDRHRQPLVMRRLARAVIPN